MPAKIDISTIVEDFVKVKDEVKKKEAKLKKYRDLLLQHVQEMGVPDDKGEVHFPVGTYIIHNKKRVSQKIDEVLATELLKKKGIYDKYVSVKLDEDKIEEGLLNGGLTSLDAKFFINVKVTDVLEVEEISNIKQEVK